MLYFYVGSKMLCDFKCSKKAINSRSGGQGEGMYISVKTLNLNSLNGVY